MITKSFPKLLPKSTTENKKWPQILAVFSASVLTLNSGILLAWTSPSIPKLIAKDSYIPMTFEQASYFTMLPSVSMILFAPFFSWTINKIGRKYSILLSSFIYFSTYIMTYFADSLAMLYFVRFFTGIGDCCGFTSLPVYIGEATEPRVRGTWGNSLSIFLYFGQFVINLIGAFSGIKSSSLICALIPILHFAMFSFAPESPYFLLMKGKREEARNALKTLRWNENVENELDKLTSVVEKQVAESGTFGDLFKVKSNKRAILVAVGLRTIQQSSGLIAFSVYTEYIFSQSGSNVSQSTSAIIFTASLAVMICFSSSINDIFGRRKLMMFSCFSCGVMLAGESIFFLLKDYTEVETSIFNWFPLAGMILYIIFCSCGIATIPTLILGEIFSAGIKNKAMVVINIVFALWILTITKVFQLLAANFGLSAPFSLFAVVCFLGVLFTFVFVPETKGKTLEEIQENLRGNKDKKPEIALYTVQKVEV